jgi:glycosyltransferase involved in cell wall biosynthesis
VTASLRILQLATGFIPQRGGIETVSSLLAREFQRLGHQAVVLTRTRNAVAPAGGVAVFRNPSPLIVLREILRADAILLHGIPVRLAWPLAFLTKRAFVIKHMWDNPAASRLRSAIAQRHPTLCVSRYMASLGSSVAGVIPNPYDSTVFTEDPAVPRDRDLVFLGRVTRDKGIFDFIRLVGQLASTRPSLTATVIGDGPALPDARTLVAELKLGDRVRFTGELAPEAATIELRRHRLFVFPALWDEPFGIVTLEALACGAAVVAYASGGIPEAVGPCGVTVPTGNVEQLASAAAHLLDHEDARAALIARRNAHLARHQASAVAQCYLNCIQHGPGGLAAT